MKMTRDNKKKILILFLLFFIENAYAKQNPKPIDFEKKQQSFVLETKQIMIPGFAGAFNPAIIRWNDSLLLCFRVRNEKLISTFQIGFVWLDKEFNPVGTPAILNIKGNPSSFARNQDPRIITLNEKLYIVYSNFIKIDEMVTRRMFLAEVFYQDEKFFIRNPRCLHPFEGWSNRWEKNWAPFIHGGRIFLAYSLLPHRIVQPSLKTGKCVTVYSTSSSIHWNWGVLRGGTPAILDGKEYLAFFHSSIKMASVHSGGKSMPHYFMGAYTFSNKPPFAITRISPEPIVGKNFYHGQEHNTWKPVRVVFPCGLIVGEKYVWVSYGRQDFEIWIAKMDKKNLYKSLVSCSPAVVNTIPLEPHRSFFDEDQMDDTLDAYFDTFDENIFYENS